MTAEATCTLNRPVRQIPLLTRHQRLGRGRDKRRQAGVGRARRAVRPADLVGLPQAPAWPGQHQRRWPERLAAPAGPAGPGSASRPRCPAGSLPPPGGNASASCPRHRDRTRPFTRWTLRASLDQRTGTADRNCWRPSATPRCARRSPTCPRTASSYWPCSPRTPHALRRHQRPAGHPRRQHRPDPQPLPRQDPPPPRHRRPDQRLRGRLAAPTVRPSRT